MKILVTGGAGHIGRSVVEHLRAAGHEVRAVDRSLRRGEKGVEMADLLNEESCYRITDGMEAVVHLANWSNAYQATPQQVFRENVTMNLNLLQAVGERKITKVVFASSIQAVSGRYRWDEPPGPSCLPYLPLDGDVPPAPGNAYALSKEVGERQVRYLVTMEPETAAVALRLPFTTHKPVTRERLGERVHWSALNEAFLMMHALDAARLIEAILLTAPPGYRCEQAGSREHQTDESVAELLATHYAHVPLRREASAMDSLCDLTRLKERYGWEPRERAKSP